MKSSNSGRDPYFGSVRFFRHLILITLVLFIIIPTCTTVYFRSQFKKMSKEAFSMHSTNEDLQNQLDSMQNEELKEEEPPVPLSSGKYGEILVDKNTWELLLVNDTHPLSRNFKVELVEVKPGQSVDSRIVTDLNEMLAEAQKAGFNLHIYSSYRDLKKQQSLFLDCMVRLQNKGLDFHEAFYESKARVALPGTSEHQTGLAIDIADREYFYLDEERGSLEEEAWMAANCARFGFILRYPESKECITGIKYEPEHFRYVGKPVAKFLTDNNLALEEFYDLLEEEEVAGKL